jgi:hypothetical protein
MISSFLYLLQRGDQRKHHEDIYKIGRTNDFNRRINESPLHTQIISVCPINNEKKCEHELIREFKSEFNFRSEFGNECFEGNEREMISSFHDYCSDHLPNREEEIDMDCLWKIEDQRLAAELNQRRLKKY